MTNFALNSNGDLYAWGKFDGISSWGRIPMVSENRITQVFSGDAKFIDITGSEDSAILLSTEDGSQWIAAKSVGAPEKHLSGGI
ncbi:MAG: hypothetical protein ACFHW5_19835 [Verrucomicrobiota bacterium]